MIESLSPDTNGQTEIGEINYGVAATDAATGTGYIMYSAEDVFARFNPDPYAHNSDHLITVVYSGGQWLYDNNYGTYTPFTPVATDVLIAALDFDADTIDSLEGVDETENGITKGYFAGDLSFMADWLAGGYDDGDFTVYGTYFIRYADAAATAYAYDPTGNLLALTDPAGNVTSYVHDNLGRVVEETNELDNTRYFVYNAAGQLVRRIDREDRVVVYQYDPLGRNTAEIWYADATDADADQNRLETILYSYDPAGRMLTAQDDAASYEYVYDSLGRVVEETQTLAGLTPVIVFSYQYSAVGLRTQTDATIGGLADAVTDYLHDPLGRVTKIEQYGVQGGNAVAEKRIDLTYDARSQYAAISYYSDLDGLSADLVMTATYAYDPSGRLTELVYTDATPDEIREFEWIYDAAGRIVAHDSDIASEDVSDYGYDATNQLTEADYDTGSDESYDYDSNGNRVLVDGTDSYTTGENNQTTSDGTYSYIYDDEGNLQYRYVDDDSSETLNTGDTDITEYAWDHRNRLTEVVHKDIFGGSTDWRAEYIYDCFNHRIASLYDIDGDSDVDIEERYVWQGKNVALDFVDTDGVGETESLELARRYLWGQMVDQLLAQETADDGGVEDVLYPVRDNLGSTRSLVEYDGDIAATYSYDSFGNVTVLVGSLTDTRYLYTCQEYDLTTGFYYYDARWYDPAVGKFVSEDPIAADLNMYRYVGNNPVLFVDPSGLISPNHPNTHWDNPTDVKPDKAADGIERHDNEDWSNYKGSAKELFTLWWEERNLKLSRTVIITGDTPFTQELRKSPWFDDVRQKIRERLELYCFCRLKCPKITENELEYLLSSKGGATRSYGILDIWRIPIDGYNVDTGNGNVADSFLGSFDGDYKIS
ncbi:MAG: RHS repeat-associated core domain-containing protein [Pirellulaceae bacterium]|nr:RHS repeat-associated core domain-containing protein [Pirellulaceae bacterium]